MKIIEDDLPEFFDRARHNQGVNKSAYAAWYQRIARVNNCFVYGGKNLVNPRPAISGMLFLRSQYAYKTACGLGLAGQCAEAFALVRSCLEYAGYALTIFDEPSLEGVFAQRHLDAASKGRMVRSFRISELKKVISKYDRKLSQVFDDMYNRSVDFGGHPNPHGAFRMMDVMPDDKAMWTWAMTNDQKVIEHILKSTAQSGLAALFMFQHIFKAKFELLGIRAELDALRNAGL